MPSHNQLLAQAQHLLTRGQLAPAESLFRQVLAMRSRNADAQAGIGVICNATGRHLEAIELFKQALAIQPYMLVAHAGLGAAYHAINRFEEAEAAFRQFLTLQPDNASMHYNLGMALKGQRKREEAAASYRRALELKPDYADAWYNLGNVQRDMARFEESVHSYEQALKFKPNFAEACNNLGHSLANLGRMDEAIVAFRRAMSMRPGFLDPMSPLANALSAVGKTDEAISLFRRTLQLRPDDVTSHSALLLNLHYQADINPQHIFEEHVQWGERHAPVEKAVGALFSNGRSPNRPLRVGYLSSDFRQHSVGFFLEGLLAAHNPTAVEVFCYNTNSYVDQVTKRFETYAHTWRDVARLEPLDIAQAITQDKIDILVELNGHTAGSRLLALAVRPAPIQVSYLGYIDTTGMRQIDYRLVDAYTDPPGMTDRFYSEQLVRLPETFAVYTPPLDAPPVAATPALANGHVTFGVFTIGAKVSAPLIETWANLLNRIDKSRLIIAGAGISTPTVQERITNLLARAGIRPDRFEIVGSQPLPQYLAMHERIDILLDPFPVNGHTITCHALWMGVPVVSRAGNTYVSRLGASVLSNLQLPELLVSSADQYVEIAASLAADLPRLTQLRTTMRDRMRTSPIMNYPAFATAVEGAYRTMWHRWIAHGT